MKKEVQIFFTALMFYTRIPIPKIIQYNSDYAQKSFKYLPLIGLLVGGISAFILFLSLIVLPISIAVILSMISSLLVTGAFHEDGLADTVDGFGGGWNKEDILRIMKDSSIGAYGTIALIITLFLKFQLLVTLISLPETNEIPTHYFILFVFFAGHSISRITAISTMITHQYVRVNDYSSKLKSVANKNIKWTNTSFIFAFIFALFPLFLFQTHFVFILLLPIYIVKILLTKFFKKWIGGYTGDCLGAIQQISEIVFYIGILILWKSI